MDFGQTYFMEHPEAFALIALLGIWSWIWKAFALYRAG